MACGPGGCGGDGGGSSWLETRLLGSLILSSTLVLGVLWIDGHRVLAVSLVSVPVVLIAFGSFFSACLDRACLRVLVWWRASRFTRKPGKLYCPECVGELRDAAADGFSSRRECPQCLGAWCASGEWLTRLAQYGGDQAVWRSYPAKTFVRRRFVRAAPRLSTREPGPGSRPSRGATPARSLGAENGGLVVRAEPGARGEALSQRRAAGR